MKKLTAALAAAAALSLGACAAVAPKASSVPGTYEVTLEGNGTTGYTWSYTMSEEGIVKETSNTSISEGTEGMVGAPSNYIWDFEALKAGTVTLTYDYARSWEGQSIKTVTYTLTVDSNLQITGESTTEEHDAESTPVPTEHATDTSTQAGALAGIAGNMIYFVGDPESGYEWTAFYKTADDEALVKIGDPVYNDTGKTYGFEVTGLKEGRANIGFTYHKGMDADGIASQYEFFAEVDKDLNVTLSLSAGNDDDSAPDGSLMAVQGDTITVTGNPTTGYDWTSYYSTAGDQEIVKIGDYVYTASSTAVGAGGTYAFQITGLKAGTAVIGLTYHKGMDADGILTDLKFTVTVDADMKVSISQQIG